MTTGLSGYAAVRVGSFGTVGSYGDLDVPLTAVVAARISGEYRATVSWIDEVHAYRQSPTRLARLLVWQTLRS